MRVLVIGTGQLARFRARTLTTHPQVSWVGIASGSRERASGAASDVGADAGGTLEALVSERPDAVVISSASGDHAGHLKACLELGVPTFCEKPVALTVEDSEWAVRAAEQAGVTLQVGFQRRFDPGFGELYEHIRSGPARRSLRRAPDFTRPDATATLLVKW